MTRSRRLEGGRPERTGRDGAGDLFRREPTPRTAQAPTRRSSRLAQRDREARRRHSGFFAVVVAFAVVALRLCWLHGVRADADAAEAAAQRTTVAARGTVLDRNGAVLAMSSEASAVYAEPRVIAAATCQSGESGACDPASIARSLGPFLGTTAADLADRLDLVPKDENSKCGPEYLDGCRGFVYLGRGLEPDIGSKVRDLGLPGIAHCPNPAASLPAPT